MRTVISFFLFFIALSFVNPVFSAILNVPEDHEDIRSALQAAEEGDTVLVQPGTYPEFIRFPDRSITLASLFLTTGDPAYIDSTILTGNGGNSVVQFNGLENVPTLIGFSVTNGRAANGGGIFVNGSSPILSDLKVFGNSASRNGGGLCANQPDSLIMMNCILSDNTSDDRGGGIEIFNGYANLTNLEIFQNESESGGGISILQGECHLDLSYSKIFENTASTGGGLYSSCGPTASLSNVEFSDNTARLGGGVHLSGLSEIEMHYCLVVNNTATERGSALDLYGEREKHFTNVTITQNISNDVTGIHTGGTSRNFFTNCIIYENGEQGIYCRSNSSTSLAYSDLEGGEDGIVISDQASVIWSDGNIDADPLFAGIECRDYSLTMDSPCIDAGDPDFPKDADSTFIDMGGIPFLQFSRIRGFVRDAENRDRLDNVNVVVSNGFNTISDENGRYDLLAVSGIYDISFSREGYNDSVLFDVEFELNDTLELNVSLLHPEFRVSDAELNVSVEHGLLTMEQISLTNSANGSLEWSAEFTVDGNEGMDPWEIREEFPAGATLNDNTLRGVVYDGENYWMVGGGENVPMIYVMNPDGDLIKQFAQPGNSHRGFRDLAWDGELFWGSDNREVFGFNSNGEVIRHWEGPFNPNNNLAWDSTRELLWICSTVSDIVACDRNGEPQITLDRNGHRIYGLAFWNDDPDGYTLYILHNIPDTDFSSLSKVNPETGDFRFVKDFSEHEGSNLTSAFITKEYDRYGGWVMLTIAEFSREDGYDRLEVFQLDPNLFFVDIVPDNGIVRAGETNNVWIVFETIDEDGIELDFGGYEGNLLFSHNAMGGQHLMPIQLDVLDPSSFKLKDQTQPIEYEISSIYPNPFNSIANIDFSLPEASDVRMNLYDLSGRLVKKIVQGQYEAGVHNMILDGNSLVSGLYLVKMEAGNGSLSRKVMLLK